MKQEWGTRRKCHQCQNAYFDMCRTIIICPKCQTHYQHELASAANKSTALNNEIPDSAEDQIRYRYSNLNIIVQELEDREHKKFVNDVLQKADEEELPMSTDLDKMAS